MIMYTIALKNDIIVIVAVIYVRKVQNFFFFLIVQGLLIQSSSVCVMKVPSPLSICVFS